MVDVGAVSYFTYLEVLQIVNELVLIRGLLY